MANANSNLATLHNQRDSKRRDEAVRSATHQMEAIFHMLLYFVQRERGEVPGWPNFDSDLLPDVTRALAIRGRDLNGALMAVGVDEISTDDLERLVLRGY